MFELFKASKEDAISIIKMDHDKVKVLFARFEASDNLREKKKIAAEAIMELKIHAEIEEKIFYPSVREDVEEDIMYEADEEHHVAKLLIAELDQMDGSEEHWEAKFTVLAENIRHHIKEEEGEMLPQARALDIDFEEIGRKLLAKKQELKKNGVPPSDEEKLISRNQKADSPARAAKEKPSKEKPRAKAAARMPKEKSGKSDYSRKPARQSAASRSKPQPTAKRTAR